MMKSTMMKLVPYQRRVVVEAFDLADRLEKLEAFLKWDDKAVPRTETAGLKEQAQVMSRYLEILDERLSFFEKELAE